MNGHVAERSERDDVRASGARIEELLGAFDRPLPLAQGRARAEELVRALVQLYGGAIDRMLEVVDSAAGDHADRVFAKFCEDPLVSGLLAIHGLHPLTTRERVQRALDGVRPYIESHQGRVDVLDVEGATVSLRMAGSCDGCPSSAATLKLAIERAIFEACPEIAEVRAEGVSPAAQSTSSLRVMSDWLAVDDLPELESTGYEAVEVAGMPVLVLRCAGSLYAYRNRCPACLRDLGSAALQRDVLSCGWCGHGFDVVHAGRSTGDGTRSLEPYPLLLENGRLQLAIPLTA